MDEELLQRARREVERADRRAARETLLRELRQALPVQIHEDRLPFSYVPAGD